MFTGIVRAVGILARRRQKDTGQSLLINPGELAMEQLAAGDSIAVNGVCLTVAGYDSEGFMVDLAPQTCALTTLAQLPLASKVNLEPALTLADHLGGHLVAGHVDVVATLATRKQQNDSAILAFSVPDAVAPYLCARGSVCIDGVSLTVAQIHATSMQVQCIPHTLQNTSLGSLQPGASVNLEVDMMARYAERLLSFRSG